MNMVTRSRTAAVHDLAGAYQSAGTESNGMRSPALQGIDNREQGWYCTQA